MSADIYMGQLAKVWNADKNIKTITFSITDDCNLACKYCYFSHKTSKNKMDYNTACETVDWILNNKDYYIYDGVIWEFIGGEPTLEMELIDQICDYILFKMFSLDHKWLHCYRIMVGTNGILYDSEVVQRFRKKHRSNVYFAITIDGNRQKHDLSRIRKDGSGSYDKVLSNVLLWKKQTGGNVTKSTFSHDDLPFLKESIVSLWEIEIKNVMANIVFENVWDDNDADIFKKQLIELADYIIDYRMWSNYSVRFFDPSIGLPLEDKMLKSNYCGTGDMLAISTNGNFYPCVRFMNSAMTEKNGLCIGNSRDGINNNKLRPFQAMTIEKLNNEKCIDCRIANGCNWCSGHNYDISIDSSILQRDKSNCKMHQANTEAARYFWHKLHKREKIVSPRYRMLFNLSSKNKKYLYICTNQEDSFVCNHIIQKSEKCMNKEDFDNVIDYCSLNDIVPIVIGSKNLFADIPAFYYGTKYNIEMGNPKYFFLCNHGKHEKRSNIIENAIIYLSKDEISHLTDICTEYLNYYPKLLNIHLEICDVNDLTDDDLSCYRSNLSEIASTVLIEEWKNGRPLDIDVITYDLHSNKTQYCGCGSSSFAVDPLLNVYNCPADTQNYGDNNYGNLFSFSFEQSKKLEKSNSPLCSLCSSSKCKFCIFDNKIYTGEYLISSEMQCKKNRIEHLTSLEFMDYIKRNKVDVPFIIKKEQPDNYIDPIDNKKNYQV